MAVTEKEIQQALKIRRIVNAYFETSTLTRIQAKDLMPDFISNGVFEASATDGLTIQKFLRKLDVAKYLKLIPQAFYDQKDVNKNWFFVKPIV